MLHWASSHASLLPQGVGKGTYATRVADAFGMCHIAAGDLVREEMKQGSELGKQVSAHGRPRMGVMNCRNCDPWCGRGDRSPSWAHEQL